jgi:uncharacterized protein
VSQFLLPLLGGVLIGASASLLLLFNGRTAGISGIAGGLFTPTKGDSGWRFAFVAGLLGGGVLLQVLSPAAFGVKSASPALGMTVVAGLLVGFGTRLGSGCTSGHGICGISRGSLRSIVATLTFMATGVLTVLALRQLTGGDL